MYLVEVIKSNNHFTFTEATMRIMNMEQLYSISLGSNNLDSKGKSIRTSFNSNRVMRFGIDTVQVTDTKKWMMIKNTSVLVPTICSMEGMG